MSEMSEAVAKAIEEAMFAPHELPLREELHRKYLDVAREAIAPVHEMLLSMLDAVEDSDTESVVAQLRRMIDEALR